MGDIFDEYFTFRSIINLGVTVRMEDVEAEKLLLYCHIKDVVDNAQRA